MPGFEDYLRQSFPNIRVTSGRRDPNSRLGRANPRSWHNKGMAWDTAPVEGMDFEQYVDRIKRDGWNVLEARDEVKNPSAHATGPHWHVATGGRKEQPQMNSLADLLSPDVYQQAAQEQRAPQPQGLAGMMQEMQAPPIPPIQQMMPAPKPKTFGQGGRGWEIMGIIGDALQTAGGGQGTYAPAMMAQRDLETQGRQKLEQIMAQAQQKQADREAALEDWRVKQDYGRENPDPTTAARMAAEIGLQPGTPQYQQFIQQYAQRPIMVGGEAYTPQSGGLPSGYNPDEWEVVE